MADYIDQGVYFIKDSYYEKFHDSEFTDNKNSNRPHYYAMKVKNIEDLYLFIPASTKVEKYQRIIDKRTAQNKETDFIHITKIGNKQSALLINKMIPVSKKYIDRPFQYNGTDFQIIENNHNQELKDKVSTVKRLTNAGIHIPFQTNLKSLLNQVVQDMQLDKETQIKDLQVTEGQEENNSSIKENPKKDQSPKM